MPAAAVAKRVCNTSVRAGATHHARAARILLDEEVTRWALLADLGHERVVDAVDG